MTTEIVEWLLLNHRKEEVQNLLKIYHVDYRIVQEDDNHYVITRDYKPQRLNLTFQEGILKEISYG